MNEETVVYGLDEEYQGTSLPDASKSTAVTGVGEFHLAPTPTGEEESQGQVNPYGGKDLSTAEAMPAVLTPQPLEFIDSTVTSSSGVIEGQVEPTAISSSQFPSSSSQDSSGWGNLRQRPQPGKAASYLESKGFGWLLEVEDQEEDAKPIL